MNIGDYLEKWGRKIFEAPLSSSSNPEEPLELAEVRLAILDRIQEKSYRAGGKKVFPFDLLRVYLRGVEESRAGIYAGPFFRRYMEQEVRNALQHSGCRFSEHLRVEVDATAELPKQGEEWMRVEVASQERPANGAHIPAARLVVLDGQANTPEVRLEKSRINIGRTVDVYRSEGLFRRNDLAFAEDTEINRSVSREHAHILFDKTAREFRLFNDRWYSRDASASGGPGIWVVRDGLSQEVHRNSRGTRLQHGDEIHFGRAVVLFQMD